MLVLVLGGSGSGKSAFAEKIIEEVSAGGDKYYIATMKIYDAEGEEKVKRHREMRAGKGYITIERPVDVHKVPMPSAGGSIALLESISNLVANEMFKEDETIAKAAVADKLCRDIDALAKGFENLVIVSDNVFEDGADYSRETLDYIDAMGAVNCRLAAMEDQVWEVVCGIGVRLR